MIYETFVYSPVTDLSVMRPATLDHYVVMDMEGLEHLQAVFEEIYKESTVLMIRTRTPYRRGGIIFKASMVTTMGQVGDLAARVAQWPVELGKVAS